VVRACPCNDPPPQSFRVLNGADGIQNLIVRLDERGVESNISAADTSFAPHAKGGAAKAVIVQPYRERFFQGADFSSADPNVTVRRVRNGIIQPGAYRDYKVLCGLHHACGGGENIFGVGRRAPNDSVFGEKDAPIHSRSSDVRIHITYRTCCGRRKRRQKEKKEQAQHFFTISDIRIGIPDWL
jgi:hypothetical protein